jgi:hypothetical protein
MPRRVYHPRLVAVQLRGGRTVRALAFVADPTHSAYVDELDLQGRAKLVAQGIGMRGRCIDYIRNTPTIRDCLISGGDPLILSDDRIEWLLSRLRKIKHVEFLRIGSKVPATLPQRVTPALVKMLKRFHPHGRRVVGRLLVFRKRPRIRPRKRLAPSHRGGAKHQETGDCVITSHQDSHRDIDCGTPAAHPTPQANLRKAANCSRIGRRWSMPEIFTLACKPRGKQAALALRSRCQFPESRLRATRR